jgi:hypothetical protein
MQILADHFTGRPPLQDFDLSRNESLQTLEILASSVVYREAGFLTHVLSTITSPVFSKVIIVYRDYDFCQLHAAWDIGTNPLRGALPVEIAVEASRHHMWFKAFREMHKVREFRLMLCADVWDCAGVYAVCTLQQAVAAEKAQRGFDGVFSEPLVISRPRGSSAEVSEQLHAGTSTPGSRCKNVSSGRNPVVVAIRMWRRTVVIMTSVFSPPCPKMPVIPLQ